MTTIRLSAGANLATLIARCVIVGPLIPNGLRKLANFEQMALAMGGTPQVIGGKPFPVPEIEPLITFPLPQLFLAGSVLFDFLAPLLIMLGLRARPAAAFLMVYCLTAMSIYHYDMSTPENLHSAIRTVPMFAGMLYIAAVGAGGWSLDAWLARRRAL